MKVPAPPVVCKAIGGVRPSREPGGGKQVGPVRVRLRELSPEAARVSCWRCLGGPVLLFGEWHAVDCVMLDVDAEMKRVYREAKAEALAAGRYPPVPVRPPEWWPPDDEDDAIPF